MARRVGGRWCGLLLVAAIGVGGCTDALTVHPVATAETGDPEVPSVTGTWIARKNASRGEDAREIGRLVIEGNEADRRQCRKGHIEFREGSDVTDLGGDVCFVDIDGYLVAELKTPPPYVFYRQFLVRIDTDTIAACGALPVWVFLEGLQESGVTGYALESLQYTRRNQRDDADLLVFISKPSELRDFLEVALPELASACDSAGPAGENDLDDLGWIIFERAPPEEPAEEAVESSSP